MEMGVRRGVPAPQAPGTHLADVAKCQALDRVGEAQTRRAPRGPHPGGGPLIGGRLSRRQCLTGPSPLHSVSGAPFVWVSSSSPASWRWLRAHPPLDGLSVSSAKARVGARGAARQPRPLATETASPKSDRMV